MSQGTCQSSTAVSLRFNRFHLYDLVLTEHNSVRAFMVHATEMHVTTRQGKILSSKKHSCSALREDLTNKIPERQWEAQNDIH